MKTTVIGYALALSVALVGAYQTWTHEGERDLSGSVLILDVDQDELASVEFDGPKSKLVLEIREDDTGAYVWGTFSSVGAEEDAPVTSESFKVGPSGETLVEGLAPFGAKRVLEGVDDSKLAELGFGDEQSTLTFRREGKDPQTYEVAGKIYSGRNRYVRDPSDGTVYVVAANIVQQLEAGRTTLPDRALIGDEVADIETITVRGGEAHATYSQNNPDDRAARFWALTGSSDPSPAAAGWFDKMLQLRVQRYVDDAARPSGLEEAFSVVVTSGRRSTEIVVYRTFDDEGEAQWYATSPHNRALVRVNASAATELQADLAAVLDQGA